MAAVLLQHPPEGLCLAAESACCRGTSDTHFSLPPALGLLPPAPWPLPHVPPFPTVQMMWAADYDPRMAAVLLHHPPEGLSLAAEPLAWSAGLPSLQPPSTAPNSSPTHPSHSAHSSLPPTHPEPSPFPAMPPVPPSLPPVLALGLGKRSGRKGGSMGGAMGGVGGAEGAGGRGMSRWGEARVGDEDLAVFCVAAILRANRKRLLQVEGSDEAIKMFNDVELVLDVASCVHLAIKIRAKYCKK
ncbi:unnamed protein product, partial [Closterium sp. NIES-54]